MQLIVLNSVALALIGTLAYLGYCSSRAATTHRVLLQSSISLGAAGLQILGVAVHVLVMLHRSLTSSRSPARTVCYYIFAKGGIFVLVGFGAITMATVASVIA